MITFDGEFFNYHGLFTFARPVQEHLPLKPGGMGGPQSFEMAGEISDGLHHALGYSKEDYEYIAKHLRIGAEKAGKKFEDLDFGAWGTG
jgi:5,10-methylenetetrahydromethanopterin reductase